MRTSFMASAGLLFGLLFCAGVGAQNVEVSRCQAVREAAARLACYDKLYPPGASGSPAPAASSTPAPNVAAQQPATDGAAYFGLPQRARPGDVDSIESTVAASFDGWGPNDKIRLQNGQVWEVIDGSSGALSTDARKVKVRRGALGSYFLDFEGLTKSPRVRRLQ
jgi:hypothetical protein